MNRDGDGAQGDGGPSGDGGTTEQAALEAMLAILREHDLDALTVSAGGTTYELVARPERPAAAPVAAVDASAHEPHPAAHAGPPANVKRVAAPIIGVFYRSSSPGSDAFVEEGDRVEVGQVLCILEAMKLMNEITSDYAGTVRRVLPENGALVSLGEELFWIEP